VEKSTIEGKFDAPDCVCICPRSLKVFKKNRYPWVNLTGSVPPGYRSIATVVNATNSAQTPATGSVNTKNNTITITVPLSAVGSPAAGSQLVSVGSYTLIGPFDSTATLNTAPITIDSTPTFDTTL